MILSLSDTLRSYDFLSGGDIFLREEGLDLPVPERENTYAESADSEGRWRVRSRALNGEGRFALYIKGATDTIFWDNVDNLLELVESAHERKGTLAYDGATGALITWDLQSITISGLPQKGALLRQRFCEVEVSFECRPYGRLAEVSMLAYRDTMLNSPSDAICLPLGATAGLTDISGNARNGTAVGGVTIGGFSPGPLTVGTELTSTDFDGTDDRVTTTYNPFVIGSSRTYMGWARRDASTTLDTIFGGSVANPAVLALAAGSQNVTFKPQNATTTTWTAAWPSNAVWHHWALTFNDATDAVALFINGALVTATTNAQAYNATPGNIQWGTFSSTTDPFDGKMAMVSVHERILSANEIRGFFNAGSGTRVLSGPIDHFTVTPVAGQLNAWGNLSLADASTQIRQQVEIGIQDDFDETNPEPLLLRGIVDLAALSGGSNSRAGSHSTNIVRAALTTSAVAVCSTGVRTHKGKWKVRVRVFASAEGCRVRLAWRLGTGSFSREQWVRVPNSAGWYDLDLGTVDIAALPNVWEGRIEAATSSGLPTLDIDIVSLIPAKRYLRLRGSEATEPPVSAIIAADDFSTHISGNLAGKTPLLAPAGNWSGAGDADDFEVADGPRELFRSAVSDSAANNGRYARCGSGTLTAQAVAVDFRLGGSLPTNARFGLLLRYTDISNWLTVTYEWDAAASRAYIQARKRVAATETLIGFAYFDGPNLASFRRLSATVDAAGIVTVSEGPRDGAQPIIFTTAPDASLATAGALATGGYGIYDAQPSATFPFRTYDNFLVTSPPAAASVPNPAIHSTRSANVLHNTARTTSSDGTTQGITPIREGQYLALPPATRSAKTSRIVVRARRQNLEAGFPDDGLADALTATLATTPRVHLGKP